MTFPVTATWRNKDYDVAVVIVSCYGVHEGVLYYKAESGTGIRADELIFPSIFDKFRDFFKRKSK